LRSSVIQAIFGIYKRGSGDESALAESTAKPWYEVWALVHHKLKQFLLEKCYDICRYSPSNARVWKFYTVHKISVKKTSKIYEISRFMSQVQCMELDRYKIT